MTDLVFDGAGTRLPEPQRQSAGSTPLAMAPGGSRGTESVSIPRDVLLRQGLGQGLAMGFGDEIEAAVRTGAGLWGNYGQTLGNIRAQNAETERQMPLASATAQIAGGVLPVVGAALAAPATGGASAAGAVSAGRQLLANVGRVVSAGDRAIDTGLGTGRGLNAAQQAIARGIPSSAAGRGAAQGAAAGAVYGGVTGFGQGEGGFVDRASSALGGAALGAGGGAVLGAAVGAAGSRVSNFLADSDTRAAQATENFASRGANSLDRLQAGFEDVQGAAERLGVAAPPITISEVGGSQNPLRGQLDSLLVAPTTGDGDTRSRLMARLSGEPGTGFGSQAERIVDQFSGAFGLDPSSRNLLSNVVQQARAQEGSLFDAVRGAAAPPVSPALASEIAALPRDVFRSADEIATARGITRPGEALVRDGQLTRQPSAEELVAIQQALRSRIDEQFAGNRSPVGAANKERAERLERLLDEALPGFGEARARYSMVMRLGRAAEDGTRIAGDTRSSGADVAARLADLSPQERMAFANGMLATLRDRVMNTNQGESYAAFRALPHEVREKIEATLNAIHGRDEGNLRMRDLMTLLNAESTISDVTGQALRGSQTAGRTFATRAREVATGGPLGGVATGGAVAALPIAYALDPFAGAAAFGTGLAAGFARDRMVRRQEEVGGSMLGMIGATDGSGFARSPGNVVSQLDYLRELVARQQAASAQATTPGMGVGRSVATPLGLLESDTREGSSLGIWGP